MKLTIHDVLRIRDEVERAARACWGDSPQKRDGMLRIDTQYGEVEVYGDGCVYLGGRYVFRFWDWR